MKNHRARIEETKATLDQALATLAEINQVRTRFPPSHPASVLTYPLFSPFLFCLLPSFVLKPKPNALKRKRGDEGEDGGVSECASEPGIPTLAGPVPVTDVSRPRKRARRIASAVVHTMTAVTIGAVAAWSALAFA